MDLIDSGNNAQHGLNMASITGTDNDPGLYLVNAESRA